MASFDIINVVGLAYKKTWAERGYLFKMAMLPFLVKLACFTVLASFAQDKSLWFSGIILLPAFFLEGWLLTHWARTIMTGGAHRWPFRISSNESKDSAELSSRGRGIMGGTVAYALINFLMAGYYALLIPYFPEDMDPQNADPRIAVVGLVMMVTAVTLFRFLWVYIPLSVNVSLEHILEKLKPLNLTFKMLGVWLICVVPAILVLQIFGEGMISVSGEAEGNAIGHTGFMVFRIAIDMMKNLIVTAGMAYAFLVILRPSKK